MNVTMILSPETPTGLCSLSILTFTQIQPKNVRHGTLPLQTSITDSNELINGIKIYYVLASKAKGAFNSLNVRNVFKMLKYFK